MAMCGSSAQRIMAPPFMRLCQHQHGVASSISTRIVSVPHLFMSRSSMCRLAAKSFPGLNIWKDYCGFGPLSGHQLSRCITNLSTNAGNNASSEKSVAQILNQLVEMSSNHASTEQISSLTCLLMTTQYQEMARDCQWLQKKKIVAYIQLLLENKVETFTSGVRQHENFPVLYSLLDAKYMDFSNRELVGSLLSLLYLGVSHFDPLVTKMFIDCRARIPTFDFAELKDMSFVTLALSRLNDRISIRGIIKRWKDLMANTLLEWTPEVLQHHCMIGSNHSGLLSADVLKEASNNVLNVINSNEQLLCDPDIIGTVLRFARIMGQQRKGPDRIPREITAKAVLVCPSLLHQCKAIHIAEICSSLKFLRCYSESLASLFEDRSLELLESENTLRDVSNLLYALTRQSAKHVRMKFISVLHQNLLVTEPDLILLSNLADSFYHMGYVPQYILRLFQKSVAEKASGIISHQSRYLRITRFLSRSKFLQKEHKALFLEKLLEHLTNIHGISTPVSTNLTVFLLTLSEEALSEKFFNSLLEQIPRWHVVGPSYRLALGLNHMPRPESVHLQKQVSEIQATLYSNLIEKMSQVSLDKLYLMTIGLVVNSKNKDPFFTDQIMHMFLKYTKSLLNHFDDVAMAKVVTVFGSIRYKLPEVYDDLASFVIKYEDILDPEKVVSVLKACSSIGYLPAGSEKFQAAVLRTYHQYEAEGNVLKMLSILYYLSLIHILPEKELGTVFSLEGIEKVDKFLSDNPEYQKVLEHFMLSLNQAVVIECPQMDVPWFHNLESGQDNVYEYSKQPWFCHEVRNCLSGILGGVEYVKSPSHSYYGHSISIEIQLDSDQNPLLLSHDNQWRDTEEVDRIAIQTYGRRSYCCNSSELGGWQKTNKRQLEIMGYRVIQIPHFEWYSMSLADHDSKLDYLQGKIFDRDDLD